MADVATAVNDGRREAWCAEHDDFAWLYDDGSASCFHECIVESSGNQCRVSERSAGAAAIDVESYREALAALLDTEHGAYGWRHQPCQCESHKPARDLLEAPR